MKTRQKFERQTIIEQLLSVAGSFLLTIVALTLLLWVVLMARGG